MLKIKYIDLTFTGFIVALLGILAFIQTTVFFRQSIYVVIFVILLIALRFYNKISYINKKLFLFIGFFMLPFIIAIFSLPISFYLEGDRFNYEELNIFGRLFNVIVLAFIIFFINSYTISKDPGLIFRWYKFGLLLLLLSALWHSLSIYTSFVTFPFETRDHLHSTYGNDYSFLGRVTGFASEPSYFVMFVVDFIVLSLLLDNGIKRKFLILFSIFLLILSLSPSGYITFLGSLLGAYLCTNIKFIKRLNYKNILVGVLMLGFITFLAFESFSVGIGEYILNRITRADLETSGRLFVVFMPFIWAMESNIFSFLFGHGLKSYSIIGTKYIVPSNSEPVGVTSTNFFTDTFWESGLIGLILLILFFIYLFRKILKSKFDKFQVFIMFFVFFDLLLSSFFRSDFATIRYFIMLYLLFILMNYDVKILRGRG